MGDVEISFVDYSTSKRIHLKPDIVEYSRSKAPPLYNLIIAKQTLHDIGAVLNFKEKTITIAEILLPMRNISNLQLKHSINKALNHNTCLAQEPESTQNATKTVVEIMDAKYDKADIPGIVRDNCKQYPKPSGRESLLPLLLKFELLFDGTLGNWNLPPVSFELKEGANLKEQPWRPLGSQLPQKPN